MGFDRITETVSLLREAGIRTERGRMTGVIPHLTGPVAAVGVEKISPEATILAVHIYGPAAAGGVACEDTACIAVQALTTAKARCTTERCEFDGKAGVFACRILVQWQEKTECAVKVANVTLEHVLSVTAKRSVNRAKVIDPETGEAVEECTDLGWSVTITELLPAEEMVQEDSAEEFTIYIYRKAGWERYLKCRWVQILLEDTPNGLRRVRVARTWEERKLTEA